VRLSHAHVNDIDMHLAELAPKGDGPLLGETAILVHGLAPDTLASWFLTLANPLADTGMRVLMYDLRGHGRTQRPTRGYRFTDLLDDLDALVLHWNVPGPVYLIGNSLGGALAFGYAARHPERVAGIVAIEAEMPTEEGFFGGISRLFDALALVSDRGEPTAAWLSRLLHAPQMRALYDETSIRRELPAGPAPDPHDFAAVACPVLCLYGSRSPLHRRAAVTRRLLPQTQSVVFADREHTLLLDARHEVREHVLAWLSERSSLPSTRPCGERAVPADPRTIA
jgi:pimeloyl-ACP methyl ester carboxylesterase